MCPIETHCPPVALDSHAARIASMIAETLDDYQAARLFASFEAGEDDGTDDAMIGGAK